MKHTNEAILIVGHGTKSPVGIHQFETVVSFVEQLSGMAVGFGYIELAQPNIEQAVAQLLECSGASKITVLPLLLLAAGHVKNDVPAAINLARSNHPKVSFHYGRDLSITPELLEVVEERAGNPFKITKPTQLQKDNGHFSLIVGRGSSDPDANSDLFKIARLLTERGRMGQCEGAFISLALPSVSEGLDRIKLLGAQTITISPYFLFAGALLDRIYDQSLEWQRLNPEITIQLAREMGPDARIAQLLMRRASEQMNQVMKCDMCMYRIPVPGHKRIFIESPKGSAHIH